LFIWTQLASDTGSLCIVKGVKETDVCGRKFKVIVDRDEKLRYLTVVLDKARGDIVQVDGLKVVLLNKPGDLVFEIVDLDAVAFVLSVDGTNKPYDDTVEVASGNVYVTLEDVSD